MKFEDIKEQFIQGIDCSQVVAADFAEKLGINREQLLKMSACFGGGMQCGETCGAVTGALMVIGLTYGNSKEGDMAQKEIMLQKIAEFKGKFQEKYPSCICRELLNYSIPEDLDKIMEEGLLFDYCPHVVQDTIEILESIV